MTKSTEKYMHKVDKTLVPTCNIMGVNVAAINMKWLLDFTKRNVKALSGDYICVSNVHTTVTAYEDPEYCAVQNGGIMAIPDGGPLSFVGRRRGYKEMERTTGPSYMEEILKVSEERGYRHYFYGSTEETLAKLRKVLEQDYPNIQIAGMYSPPFRPLTEEEDTEIVGHINEAKPDFVWVGLGAPKQERWMAEHQGRIDGFMVGVGAGFDYLAGNIERAPEWMQKCNLEWVYRLLQDPKRLFGRYWHTNLKFIRHAMEGIRKEAGVERKPKVLIVHNYYQVPGGEDTVVANEKQLLEENGHEVVFYSRNNSELKSFSKLQKLMLSVNTIFNLRTYRDIKKIIREEHIDILHVHNTLNLISPSVYYAARRCKVPVVQTIHNFRLLCPGATLYRDGHICEECIERGLLCAVKHGCYRNSRIQTLACVISTNFHRVLRIYGKLNYICLTEFNKEKLLQLKQIKAEKVFVKPNFEDVQEKVIPYEKREERFVYAGRLDKLKGIDLLLEAWKKMGEKAPRLLICGTGPLEGWCRSFVQDSKVCNVEMTGFVPNAEVKKIVANSKALILPTQWYEGFPMSIVEAFSVGTPVITSDMGNAGSLIVEGVTGCKFAADSVDEIVKAVERIGKYMNICETVRNVYEMNYTAKKNYEMLRKIYDSVEEC